MIKGNLTVKELIAILEKQNPDAIVAVYANGDDSFLDKDSVSPVIFDSTGYPRDYACQGDSVIDWFKDDYPALSAEFVVMKGNNY